MKISISISIKEVNIMLENPQTPSDTINLEKIVDNITINNADISQSTEQMEKTVQEAILRTLNNATS